MYCYPFLTGLTCALTELVLWANTSKEHQTFLLTVAELINLDLPPTEEEALTVFHQRYQQIETSAGELQEKLAGNGNYFQIKAELSSLLRNFLSINVEFLAILQNLKTFGAVGTSAVWQILVEHMIDEQLYMDNTFRYLLSQLYY